MYMYISIYEQHLLYVSAFIYSHLLGTN